ncbi:MAG: hypothetical protein OP8BY_1435 [Candidatus Saccharicenans subterraneus]|uniref:Uncharacterized protein n=1 Tax=Candidatus Saccharicenans subterraneus TaxID=2508984 RepID=A0A3E2BJL4_9BACT|nr:MAG: hypothetical protein OP8BY_1435 [Candidatus Saccharicenans subterraneum]
MLQKKIFRPEHFCSITADKFSFQKNGVINQHSGCGGNRLSPGL